jgi:hypothetical protein
MGGPMAKRLLEAGHEVALWSHGKGKAEALGSKAWATPPDISIGCIGSLDHPSRLSQWFPASPETIRRRPRDVELRRPVGNCGTWQDARDDLLLRSGVRPLLFFLLPLRTLGRCGRRRADSYEFPGYRNGGAVGMALLLFGLIDQRQIRAQPRSELGRFDEHRFLRLAAAPSSYQSIATYHHRIRRIQLEQRHRIRRLGITSGLTAIRPEALSVVPLVLSSVWHVGRDVHQTGNRWIRKITRPHHRGTPTPPAPYIHSRGTTPCTQSIPFIPST